MSSMQKNMNKTYLLSKEEQDFIQQHEQSPLHTIALLKNKYPDLRFDRVLQQINGLKKAKKKLPEWSAQKDILFPIPLSMEQCSSEQTAKFKAKLVGGKSLLDMTGGMGVDTYYLSKSFQHTIYCELQEELAQISKHNFEVLGTSIETYIGDGLEKVNSLDCPVDCIYLDPARRGEANQKVFFLEDCVPNIVEIQGALKEKSKQILVKCAPMLDIHQALNQLQQVSQLYIISVQNECKELLFHIKTDQTQEAKISCIHIHTNGEQDCFEFSLSEESNSLTDYGNPEKYMYLPNSSILKGGAFKIIGKRFGLNKLAKNSHLYTSDKLIPEFPGRIFEVIQSIEGNQKKIRKHFKGEAREIISRNFPLSSAQIEQKWNIQTGSQDKYIIATQNSKAEKQILDCIRIK